MIWKIWNILNHSNVVDDIYKNIRHLILWVKKYKKIQNNTLSMLQFVLFETSVTKYKVFLRIDFVLNVVFSKIEISKYYTLAG